MPYVGQKPADIISTAVDTTTGTFSGEVDAASLDISGNIDVDGTTNLDVVDIDGVLTQDGGAVFNEASADVDFRVESNGNANMLVIDGGDDVIAIGAAKDAGATVKIQNKDDGNTNTLDLFNDNGNRTITMQQDTTGNAKMRFQKNDGTFTTTIDANLGGILFGTDTAAANTLDDYEKGTWTPTLTGSSSGTRALSSVTATYIKVGSMVTATLSCAVDGLTGSASGGARLGGFPFNYNGSVSKSAGTVNFGYALLPSTENVGNITLLQASSGTSNVFFWQSTFNNHAGGELGITAFQDNSDIVTSITYQAV